ncbi:hypothetical protein HaLaN_07913, partial [Haematococcus lacustris]
MGNGSVNHLRTAMELTSMALKERAHSDFSRTQSCAWPLTCPMAAIDALSRLPPLKDVETKAQGTLLLQLSCALCFIRSSTSALQKHREGRNVYQFLRSRPATTTSWDAGLSSAATAERSSHLSSVQQQRRSPYQQAMTQRVTRKPMVSGGQAQVQAGPAGLAPGSPAPAASRQPPARVEPGHRGQWGTAAEQHLSREPAGQPAGQRSEWAGQSTEAWRSARSSEALK